MDNVIRAEALTGLDVSPDGSIVRLNVKDGAGGGGSLELPAMAVNQLLMALPGAIQQALRRSHGNEDLQIVHALDCFRFDDGEPDEHGRQRYVLTLRTSGGYEVPFAMTGNQLGVIVQTVVEHLMDNGAVLEQVELNS